MEEQQPTTAVAGLEARTRDRVLRAVLADGPVTVAHLAEVLGLTPQAVRRHVDALVTDGTLADSGRASAPEGTRGRPARTYALTPAGHAALGTAYDDLAASALAFLAAEAGAEAVERFAASRVAELERRYLPVVDAAGAAPDVRAAALAGALSADGYAASLRAREAAEAPTGAVALCQGHCPVQAVATAFPQFCDAETEVFARLLGVPVQRVGTLAGGAHACTTVLVPPTLPAGSRSA